MSVTIWHNPRCSKSRQTLALLEQRKVDLRIREYLKDLPDEAEIRAALQALGTHDPRAIMRRGEAIYKELGLDDVVSKDALIAAMVAHPVLIERPVVLANGRAALGRPPESVLEIL